MYLRLFDNIQKSFLTHLIIRLLKIFYKKYLKIIFNNIITLIANVYKIIVVIYLKIELMLWMFLNIAKQEDQHIFKN